MNDFEMAPGQDFLLPPPAELVTPQRLHNLLAVATLITAANFAVSALEHDDHVHHNYLPNVSTSRYYPPEMTRIPAEPSDTIQLSDDWGGVLGAAGYGIVINQSNIVPTLESRQLVVIEETDTLYPTGIEWETEVQRITVFADEPYLYPEDGLSEEQDAFIKGTKDTFSFDGLGTIDEFQPTTQSDTLLSLGSGIVSHSAKPAKLTYKKYELDEDGGIQVLEEKTATATITPNVDCPQVPNPVSSEVVLTAAQQDTICGILGDYNGILPDDYRISLDSVLDSLSARDSILPDNRTMQLTYPYVGDQESPTWDVRETAIHEILHTTYSELDSDSTAMQEANAAYMAISSTVLLDIGATKSVTSGKDNMEVAIPVWAAITESTYIGGDSKAGHPWDKPTEMLSSTGSILHDYPTEFVGKYRQLPLTEQAALRAAVLAVGSLIRSAGVEPTSIIPTYDETVAQLQK